MSIKTTLNVGSKSPEPSLHSTSSLTSIKMSIIDQLKQLIAEDFDSHCVLARNINGPRSLQSHPSPLPTTSSSNLSTYYDAEEGNPTPPPPSPHPLSSSPSPSTFDSLPDATWDLEQLPPQSPTTSATLFSLPNSSITAVDMPWEEDTSYIPLLSPNQWDIPNRQDHPQLNTMLTYISTENVPDYCGLHFLSKCTPTNDFTRLCQHLCMDGATQYLSGCIQSVDFSKPDLADLFGNLEWWLGSKTGKNDFYEACGKPPPFPPMQGALNKEFRQLNNEWTWQTRQYGRWSTAKYFH